MIIQKRGVCINSPVIPAEDVSPVHVVLGALGAPMSHNGKQGKGGPTGYSAHKKAL